jgi:hypothetical protein
VSSVVAAPMVGGGGACFTQEGATVAFYSMGERAGVPTLRHEGKGAWDGGPGGRSAWGCGRSTGRRTTREGPGGGRAGHSTWRERELHVGEYGLQKHSVTAGLDRQL